MTRGNRRPRSAWRVDITDQVVRGRNRIEVEVTNSLRNLLGPHHFKGKEGGFVNALSFSDEWHWNDDYRFVECGVLGNVRLVRTRG